MPNEENNKIEVPQTENLNLVQPEEEKLNPDEVLKEYKMFKELSHDPQRKKAWKKYNEDQELKPYQAELIGVELLIFWG